MYIFKNNKEKKAMNLRGHGWYMRRFSRKKVGGDDVKLLIKIEK